MTNLLVRYDFHPVGQGLFSSGALHVGDTSERRFSWVYDCGTSSSKRLLETALDKFELHFLPGEQDIDLVTISHFDRDHVNGLVSLLRRFRVKTLMLPYMPLWQRLIIGFVEGADTDDDFFSFLINPVEYLASIDGVEIEVFLFIQSGGDEPPNAIDGPSITPDSPDFHLNMDYDKVGSFNDEKEENKDWSDFRATNKRVFFLAKNGRLSVSSIWEFIPYNDAAYSFKADKGFCKEVSEKRNILLNKTNDVSRKEALENLKETYDETFGKDQVSRNAISLFLYAGPTVETYRKVSKLFNYWTSNLKTCPIRHTVVQTLSSYSTTEKLSILYTGDGYVDTPKRFSSLKKRIGLNKAHRRLSTLQVMHHGSRNSWYEGVASKFSPSHSVFCSNPLHKRFKHPHAEVLKDFWEFGPIQVDKETSFHVVTEFQLPIRKGKTRRIIRLTRHTAE